MEKQKLFIIISIRNLKFFKFFPTIQIGILQDIYQYQMYDFYNLKTTTPLVIAHRGLSSMLPENTTEAAEIALQYSDFSELDIMLTADNEIIVFHDNYLSRLTNVADIPQFKHKRREGKDYDKVMYDWWVTDFTLKDLKKLQLRQAESPNKRPTLWNWRFTIPTFRQFIQTLLAYKEKRKSRTSGLMIELKQQDGVNPQSLVTPFVRLLTDLKISSKSQCFSLQLPLLLASFNERILIQTKKLTDLPLLQLIDEDQKYNIQELSKTCVGIGTTQKVFLQSDFKIVQDCHSHNMGVFYWTLRIDSEPVPFGCSNYQEVHMKLIQGGVDGLITQFPQTTSAIIRMMKYIK